MLEDALEDVLRSLAHEVAGLREVDAVAHATLLGGKHLRARLVLLAATAAGESRERAVRRATFLELLHAGALCHDDVFDRSLVRRGQATVEARHGTRCAVLAGIHLLALAGRTLAVEDAPLRRTVARALRDVARGQTDELGDRFDACVSPAAYLRRAYAKTGALYELAAAIGCAPARDARLHAALAAFGADVGVAFQLADDVLDLTGGAVLQREAGTDLRQGIFTHPVLATLGGAHSGGDELVLLLREVALAPARERCVALLRANGALDATAALVETLVQRAIARLDALPAGAPRARLAAFALELTARARGQGSSPAAHDPGASVSRGAPPAIGDGIGDRDHGAVPDPALVRRVVRSAAAVRRARAEACRERMGARVPSTTAQPWVESAIEASALGITIASLAADVEDGPRSGAESEPVASERWARNVARLAAIDLGVAELYGLCAALPSRVAGVLAAQLATLSGRLARASDPPPAGPGSWSSALHGYADAIAVVVKDELRRASTRACAARAS